MIERIRFKNFKAFKDVEVKLGPFNVIVGPNGSGKTSVLQGLEAIAGNSDLFSEAINLASNAEQASVEVFLSGEPNAPAASVQFTRHGRSGGPHRKELNAPSERNNREPAPVQIFALEPAQMAGAVDAKEIRSLNREGSNLAGALTALRDQDDDSYRQLQTELSRWLPEFDQIGFRNDDRGRRMLFLRQKATRQMISATQLSEGTLLALALLAIVYQSSEPTLVALEEPDRALHPRLLRDVRDALYRLAFPTDYGLKRKPVQVVATTHSPYFLDLFREHPEQIIVAEKLAEGAATLRNLGDDKALLEQIGDAPLGEVWFSGILGGVPVGK